DVLFTHAGATAAVLDPLYASRMVRMLEGVVDHGTGTAAALGRIAAGKTGTSQNWRDAWFVGFTPDLLAAVWVGDDRGRPMAKVTGGEIPATVWRRFMTVAEADVPTSDFPWLEPEPAPPPAPADETPAPDAASSDDMAGAAPIDEPPLYDESPPPAPTPDHDLDAPNGPPPFGPDRSRRDIPPPLENGPSAR
ncbi:MAG: penicillin-binding transpeptidase domain-containing protein, partial [Caulobacteraceae bacterium]